MQSGQASVLKDEDTAGYGRPIPPHEVSEQPGLSDRPEAKAVPAVVYRIGPAPALVVNYLSPGFAQLAGFPVDRLIGRSLSEAIELLVHPADRERVEAVYRRASAEAGEYVVECRVLDSSGREYWTVHYGSALPGEDGSILGVQGVAIDITRRRLAELLFAGQARVLEMLNTGRMLHEVLGELVRVVEAQSPGMLCSVLLLNEDDRLETCAAPSLPAEYSATIDGLPIGPNAGSCGTACWRGETVVVGDIASDPLWQGYRVHALAHGLRACWSRPIVGATGRVLGAFAMYYSKPRLPAAAHVELMNSAVRLAGIAIETRRTQEVLLDQTQRLSISIDQAAIGMVEIDPHGDFREVNRRFCEIVGHRATELVGRSVMSMTHPDDRERNEQLFAQSLAGQNATFQLDKRYMRSDDSYVWVSVVGAAIRDARGVPKCIVCAVNDITERRSVADALQNMNAELERRVHERTIALEKSNRELESFSYSVSHDLRAPLRALDGFAHLLADEYGDRLDETGHDYLRRIRSASQRLGSLIDHLLELARISRAQLDVVPVSLTAIVESLREELSRSNPLRTVNWDIAPGLDARGDPLLLRAALENLLRNAWNFTRYGASPVVRFGMTDADGTPTYFVADNGEGFDMRFAEKLFEPFQRLHDPSRFAGTGIGLAIVRKVIERHGGKIWAEAKPGVGATFHFTLQ